jgi:hypothetical protein
LQRIIYKVSPKTAGGLHVSAAVQTGGGVSVFSMRSNYGPARDYLESISGLTIAGDGARLTVEKNTLMAVSPGPFSLSYDCILPEYHDSRSLLRGFRRNDTLFAPGMAIFFSLRSATAEYEIQFDCPVLADNPSFRFDTSDLLERSYFVLGPAIAHAAGQVRLVTEPDFPYPVAGLAAILPGILQTAASMLDDVQKRTRTIFLFASPEHAAGRPGTGFSIPNGALVSVSSKDELLHSKHTLWLLLHEWIHQWLGERITMVDPGDDWFFEGFTNFLVCEVLTRSGIYTNRDVVQLLRLSHAAIGRARKSGHKVPGHTGFVAARRWNRILQRHGSPLVEVLAQIIRSHHGTPLQGKALVDALHRTSSVPELPDFMLRLTNTS